MKTTRRAFAAALAAGTAHGQQSDAPLPRQPADGKRSMQPTEADLGSAFPDVERLAGPESYPYSFLSGRFRSLPEFHAAARAKVFEVLQYEPAKVAPRAEVVNRADMGSYVREKIVFSTTPHFRVPAYVLIPKQRKGRGPAIVDLHSHGGMFIFGKEKVIDFGENHPSLVKYHADNYAGRPTATELVKRGYVVITIDAFPFGERRIIMDADLKDGSDRSAYTVQDLERLNQRCRSKESTLAKSLTFAGMTWAGIVAWDDIRTVDYLVSRPEVDPERIGCIGVSMGGYRSLYLAALDDRIRAACVSGFMSTSRSMLKSHVDTHSFVHFVPGLHRYLDFPDIASLTAPRALLVQQCSRDRLFPLAGMEKALERIGTAYAKANVAAQFRGQFYDGPHQLTRPMQEEAFAWFERHLRA